MGCTSSSSGTMDAQAMLEKQREMMMQRQKEFELKRQQQNAAPIPTANAPHTAAMLAGAKPPPIVTNNKAASTASSTKTGSAPPSPATPMKATGDQPSPLPQVSSSGRPVSTKMKLDETPSTSAPPTVKKVDGAKPDLPKSTEVSGGAGEEPAPVSDARAQKYMVDPNDLSARRSKNVHDFAMYAKDVTRRPSFNPRPSESPFTPEMQAMMKAGHEAMVAAELEKKAQRLREAEKGDTAQKLPTFEDDEEEKKADSEQTKPDPSKDDDSSADEKDEDANSDDGENAASSPAPPPAAKKEAKDEDFSLNIDEAKKKADAERLESTDTVPDDPNVAKFVARDNQDRKSKNIHDLGQYFNRRASFIPGEPGSRRPSFQPEPANRRYSYLPPPTPGGAV